LIHFFGRLTRLWKIRAGFAGGIVCKRRINFNHQWLGKRTQMPSPWEKLGGSKGGKIRAAKLTHEERSEIARKAVLARWAKARQKDSRDKA
jgi:hypothetical protein